MIRSLRGSRLPLCKQYDVAMLDLDGVVYTGSDAVDGVPGALALARAAGMRLAFVTNNASRTPQIVAKHLTQLGVPAQDDEVITSAHAAASHLAATLPRGASVLVIGADGLFDAVREVGLVPVTRADDGPRAVVQGYGPDVDWWALAEGSVALAQPIPWVASNLDATLPSARGPLPGNGSLVAALAHASGRTPDHIVGKPNPAMHKESVQRSKARTPLVVGDRLDTDIAGAIASQCDSMLVLSGIADAAAVISAPPDRRPTYLASDVGGLLQRHPDVSWHPAGANCGSWRVARTHRGLRVSRRPGVALDGSERGDSAIDALRALCSAAWRFSSAPRVLVGGDAAGVEVLEALGL